MSINNVDKILSYIYPVAIEDISFRGKIFPRINHVYLSKSLFYKDSCNICGKCCIAETNVFLPFEVDRMIDIINGVEKIDNVTHKTNNKGLEYIKELKDSLVSFNTEVNGKRFVLYSSKLEPNVYEFPDRGRLVRCHWDLPAGDGLLGCGIHQVSSLTCQMPHVRFLYRKDLRTTHIGMMQYGRNWALKCPIEFDSTFYKESVDNLLHKFNLLEQYCDYFEIKTVVPKIIHVLESVNSASDISKICGIDLVNYKPNRGLF